MFNEIIAVNSENHTQSYVVHTMTTMLYIFMMFFQLQTHKVKLNYEDNPE